GAFAMIHQSPEELIEYNARLKAQRDDRARLLYAQQQGIEQGREEGRVKGEILLLQKLLLLPVWTDSQFAACTIQELSQVSADLQHRLIAGRS
ncbi:MAG: hypothetical protein ACK5AN_24375, partial [Planctomyces sp.]